MIKDIHVAKEISDLMIELTQRIDTTIVTVQEHCSEDEFQSYRLAAAKVLAEAYLEVMAPIYALHPSLEPAGLRR